MGKQKPDVVLFLCRCGTNIANFIDLDALAREFGDRAQVASHDLLCSPAGRKFYEETIAKSRPSAVVVAACSPKMHQTTFESSAEAAGLNRGKVQMANIREQAAWVTPEKTAATHKAGALLRAALARVTLHEELHPEHMECKTDVIVIGGGIAGIEAALLAANAGRRVTIIEKEISLGGSLIKTEEVAPAMECAPCLLAPRLAAVRENKNITVVTNAEVTDALGFFGNFTVKARRKARYVKNNCIGCEACFETCPVSMPSAFHLGMGTHKAIHTLFAGSVPAAAAIERDACKHFIDGCCDACAAACPFQSIDFDDKDELLEFTAGAVIVAIGAGMVASSALASLGYGKYDNVVTMHEFERMASSNGPFGGEVRLKNGAGPESIAVVHCAGSLRKKGIDYCSGICCMLAAKAGELARKKNPQVKVCNIHDRLVFEGHGAQAFFDRQVEEGTRFVKTGDLCAVSVSRDNSKLRLTGPDIPPLTVDMVVLSTGGAPAAIRPLSRRSSMSSSTPPVFSNPTTSFSMRQVPRSTASTPLARAPRPATARQR